MRGTKPKLLTIVEVAALLGIALGLSGSSARAQDSERPEVLVHMKAGTDVNALAADYSTIVEDGMPETGVYELRVPSNHTTDSFLAALHHDRRVRTAEPDSELDAPEVDGSPIHKPFDRSKLPGAYLNQAAYTQVHLGKALTMAKGTNVTVAILDTGVAAHPALQGHLVPGYNVLAPDTPPADVPDGLINNVVGHGTMIAGLIARLAPNAKIMPIRVLDGDGYGTTLTVVKGIRYALQHGARVISLSCGSPKDSETLRNVLDDAERYSAVIVAAAGNDGLNMCRYPAANANVIAVAAVESNNQKTVFSNYGRRIQVVAPGTNIRSTFWDGGYATWAGTSFSVPFISAEAALILSKYRNMEADSAAETIRRTAHPVDSVNVAFKGMLGRGIVDIEKAVRTADN